MKVISRSREAEAVQWTNTDESLAAIQALIFPQSPYRPGNLMEQIAVAVADPSEKYVGARMVHVTPGSWVIKLPVGGLTVVDNAQFEQMFSSPELLRRAQPLDLDRLAAFSAESLAAGYNVTDPGGPGDVPMGGPAPTINVTHVTHVTHSAKLPKPSWETDRRSGVGDDVPSAPATVVVDSIVDPRD